MTAAYSLNIDDNQHCHRLPFLPLIRPILAASWRACIACNRLDRTNNINKATIAKKTLHAMNSKKSARSWEIMRPQDSQARVSPSGCGCEGECSPGGEGGCWSGVDGLLGEVMFTQCMSRRLPNG